jgi:hypothetical protein
VVDPEHGMDGRPMKHCFVISTPKNIPTSIIADIDMFMQPKPSRPTRIRDRFRMQVCPVIPRCVIPESFHHQTRFLSQPSVRAVDHPINSDPREALQFPQNRRDRPGDQWDQKLIDVDDSNPESFAAEDRKQDIVHNNLLASPRYMAGLS